MLPCFFSFCSDNFCLALPSVQVKCGWGFNWWHHFLCQTAWSNTSSRNASLWLTWDFPCNSNLSSIYLYNFGSKKETEGNVTWKLVNQHRIKLVSKILVLVCGSLRGSYRMFANITQQVLLVDSSKITLLWNLEVMSKTRWPIHGRRLCYLLLLFSCFV